MSHPYLRRGAIVGHIVVLAAALTCLRLGWWQWEVFEAARGTGQNLGYALLWPVFAGSFIFMWLRFLHLEDGRRAAESVYLDDGSSPGPDDVSVDDGPQSPVIGSQPPVPAPSPEAAPADSRREASRSRPPRRTVPDPMTTGLGYIATDDEDDPELAAYNRALAQLAEEDERRGR